MIGLALADLRDGAALGAADAAPAGDDHPADPVPADPDGDQRRAAWTPRRRFPGFPTDSYLDFAIAFPFIQGSLFASINAGSAVARDVETGFLNRLALTPMQRAAMLLGHLAGVMVVALICGVIYLAVGFAAGLHFESGPLGVVVLLRARVADRARVRVAWARSSGCAPGSGEAVQGVFPLFFVFLFLSSSSLPRDLIEHDWFRIDRHLEPGLVPVRGPAVADHLRLAGAGAGARVRVRGGDRADRRRRLGERPADAAGGGHEALLRRGAAASPTARPRRSRSTRSCCCRR